MDRFCPECNNKMNASIVGHLCINCGHIQRFHSTSEGLLVNDHDESYGVNSNVNVRIIDKSEKPADKSINKIQAKKSSKIKPQSNLKAKLSSMFVPKISQPHYKQILSQEDIKNN